MQLIIASTAFADTGTGQGDKGGEGSGPFTGLAGALEANLFTGALGLSVPIVIPPGRKNATPDLKLVYSSAAGSGPFGHGWDLPLGSVVRSAKHGVPHCKGAHTDDFVLMLSGGATELVASPGDPQTYVPRIDESYVEARYEPSSKSWVVHDRSGMTYRFGQTPGTRAWEGSDTLLSETPCAFIGIWALDQIEDPNGNSIDVSYLKSGQTLYPDQIAYGGNPGAGVSQHPFRVRFGYEPASYPRTSYRRGVEETHDQRVASIFVETLDGQDYEVLRTYALGYASEFYGGRDLLDEVAADLLPTQSFEYSTSRFGLLEEVSYQPPPGLDDGGLQFFRQNTSGLAVRRTVMDMNGDGFTDLVVPDDGGSDWTVYYGSPDGFQTTGRTWTVPSGTHINHRRTSNTAVDNPRKKQYETLDLTGDGIPDFVFANHDNKTDWTVYPGACSDRETCGFQSGINWSSDYKWLRVEEFVDSGTNRDYTTTQELIDLNGDGRLDLVVGGSSSTDPWTVCLNMGVTPGATPEGSFDCSQSGFYATGSVGERRTTSPGLTSTTFTYKDVFDVNGDGLPDLVEHIEGGFPPPQRLSFRLNTGTGFAQPYFFDGQPPSGPGGIRIVTTQVGESGEVTQDFVDVNGDGLPELLYLLPAAGLYGLKGWWVHQNQGGTLDATGAWYRTDDDAYTWKLRRDHASLENSRSFVDFFDWNGDGHLDHVQATGDPWTIRLARPATTVLPSFVSREFKGSLLVRARNGVGGVMEAEYAPSSHFASNGPVELPFVTWAVTATRRTDGLPCDPGSGPFDWSNDCVSNGHELQQAFEYTDGLFDAESREFRGFRTTTERTPDGNRRVVVFSQDDATRGKMLEDRRYAGDPGELVKSDVFQWTTRTSLGRTQVYLEQHESTELAVVDPPAQAPPARCLLNRNEPPDDYGRIGTTCTLACDGAPPTPGSCAGAVQGQLNTVTVWADPVAGSWVRERPRRTTVEYEDDPAAAGLTLLTEKRFRYDGPLSGTPLPLGQVDQGNVRYVESRLDQSFTGDSTDPLVETRYDAFGNVVALIGPRAAEAPGDPTRFETTIEHNGPYGLYPRVERTQTAAGVTHETTTETSLLHGQPTSVTDRNGGVSTFVYDELGRLLCHTRPDIGPAGAGYNDRCDGTGTPALERAYEYGDGSPTWSTLPYVEERVRHPKAPGEQLVSRRYVDALGRQRYTTEQRVVGAAATLTEVVVEQTLYDSGGRVAERFVPYEGPVSDEPTAASTELTYVLNGIDSIDPLGRIHRMRPPDDRTVTSFYEGTVVRQRDPEDNETRSTLDAFGREIRRELYEGPGATTLRLRFDYVYDGLGRLLTSDVGHEAGPDAALHYTYDELGRRIQVDDPDSGIWRYGYDAAGNLLYQDDPIAGRVQYCYDELDRLTSRWVVGGSDAYDPSQCSAGCDGTEESCYAYDESVHEIGRLSRVTDRTGYEEFDYDERGRPTARTKSILGISDSYMAFDYNAADQLSAIRYPDGELVSNGYNAAGLPTLVSGVVGAGLVVDYVADVDYDLFGRIEKIDYGNGVTDQRVYHPATHPTDPFRLHAIRTIEGSTTPETQLLDLTYAYDAAGRIEGITDVKDATGALSNTAQFRYDGLGRLEQVYGTPSSQYDRSYAHDHLGNLTQKGVVMTYSPMHPHRIGTVGGSVGVDYDANGRMDAKFAFDYSWLKDYRYDGLGQLAAVVHHAPAGTPTQEIDYGYDHSGRRVWKTVDGGEPIRYFSAFAESRQGKLTKHYFLGGQLVAARNTAAPAFSGATFSPGLHLTLPPWLPGALGLVVVVLLIGPGGRTVRIGIAVARTRALGTLVAFVVAMVPFLGCGEGDLVWYYHVDHAGSTQAISGQSGSLLRQIRYHPYGEIRGRFSGTGAPLQADEDVRHEFAGYESDAETGLAYAGARFLDPELGQFLTQDAARQFASPYAYGGGNPLTTYDPDGNFDLASLVGLLPLIAVAAASAAADASAAGGDLGDSLKAFGISFGVQLATAAVAAKVGPAASAALANAPPAVQAAVSLASVGYGGYVAVEAARNKQPVAAAIAAVSTLQGAHGLVRGGGGRSLPSGGSGGFELAFVADATTERVTVPLRRLPSTISDRRAYNYLKRRDFVIGEATFDVIHSGETVSVSLAKTTFLPNQEAPFDFGISRHGFTVGFTQELQISDSYTFGSGRLSIDVQVFSVTTIGVSVPFGPFRVGGPFSSQTRSLIATGSATRSYGGRSTGI
ncbi:MAG: SpvB/TcaC N-terminal domain-containing protein [Myxococcota bacterium]|nr:SpvB/TcaC N-terminal domain-containing protein [Myxococcota bacterium]